MPVEITFASKHPHKTLWLEISHPVTEEPTQLLADLEVIGWIEATKDKRGFGPLIKLPPFDGVQSIWVNPPDGTGLFGGWTDEERAKHMRACRAVLRHHGFTRVPHWKKTITDML